MSIGTGFLRCSGVRKSFALDRARGAALDVLKGIDLEVCEGEIVCIVGVSGSGKSTLLHILGGLDRPSEGKVFWFDKEIFSLGDEALARLRGEEVGFVFQFHHLLPEFSAMENVMIPLMIRGRGKKEAETEARSVLGRVGLADRLDHRPGELSGGEQQRVAVARALANRPKIIFADEPTGNLDSLSGGQIHDLIFELNRKDGQTFVIVTHNEDFARQSSRMFRMVDGKLQGADRELK